MMAAGSRLLLPRWRQLGCRLALILSLLAAAAGLRANAARGPIDFDRDIRPILSDNCFACHGPDEGKRKAGLRLDTRDSAFGRLKSGATAIVPRQPQSSALLRVVSLPRDDDDHMPPASTGKQLNRTQIDLLKRWIEQGAEWAEHWAYVPPARPPVPPSRSGVRNPIDAFVLAKLKENGLTPNGEADRATLIRRLTLDLTGLPPTVAEVDAFVADRNPDAYETLVERLLASPHFGERMAQAWLDQARYADTAGYHFDGFRQMHHWRDWVIGAFNGNLPFDQFTIEQLAGDLLPNPTLEQRIATGFHRNVMTTDEGGVDPEEYLTKYQVDRVATTAQVWLGTTLACAECHDHKYDPLSQRDFYRFYAFFNGLPEKGLDGTRVRNPGPVLRLPTVAQGSRLLALDEQIPAAEKAQADREAELPKAQEKWEKSLGEEKSPEIPGLVRAFGFEPPETPTNTTVPGRLGRALALPGRTNEFVDAGQAVRFESTNAFSYGAWIRLHDTSGTVLSKMEPGPGYRGVDLLLAKGKIEVHLVHRFPDNALKVASKEALLATNVWTHVLVTYDGSKKAAGVKLYVDGRLRELERPIDALSGSVATDAPLLLGTRPGAFPFHGLLDEVRFHDRALASNEVAQLFAHPYLQLARTPRDERTTEQREELKKFFRDHRAVEFLAARAHLRQLQQERKDLVAAIPDTMVMQEMEKPRDTFILVRGSYQHKGEKVTPGTPACWPPLPADAPPNRLALARWLVSTNNPLTARVTVNRLWSMFFGTGLVKTANDFGSQGERPSHPELLDWLAWEFMAPAPNPGARPGTARPANWDVKHLVRQIVTSAAYRRSAVVHKARQEADPYNRLLWRGPRLRLDAEFIRDNALAASGLLDRRIGGPSVKPYQPPGLWEITDHKYEPSKGRDLYRRGLYVFWKRAVHYPSFATFDAPSREVCTVQRQRTSTPLQSLVVMNDPVYVEAARALGTRALLEAGPGRREQLIHAFRLVLARPPRPGEIAVLERTFREQQSVFAQDKAAAEALLGVGESPRPKDLDPVELAAMTGVANVLLNLNETLTR